MVDLYTFSLFLVAVSSLEAVYSLPSLAIDNATFVPALGTGGTYKYLAIPYALPPVGDLRYRLPQPNAPYTGTYAATDFGPACYQQAINIVHGGDLVSDIMNVLINTGYDATTPQSEDCLTLNVWTPPGTTAGANLPVVFWIYGGGFSTGTTSGYDGGAVVAHSISVGTPIIYVSVNYRLSGLGFLGGQDVWDQQIGNLGLQDQRLGMRWVQSYISKFGGDPTKVTLWGQSAGAISVSMHMIANNGDNEGLFRAAYMQSGSVLPTGTVIDNEAAYRALLAGVGCNTTTTDAIACLRTIPYDQLADYFDNTPGLYAYNSLHLTWTVRADGYFINDLPQKMLLEGKVARIPLVTGDVEDEGTAFAIAQTNDTSEAQFTSYVTELFFPSASAAEIQSLLVAYPSDPAAGAPYNTSILNAVTPVFKQFASFLGDLFFQTPRRFFLLNTYNQQPTWSYLYTRGHDTPVVGADHSSDNSNYYNSGDMATYLIQFVNNMTVPWPQWTNSTRSMLVAGSDLLGANVVGSTTDTFREGQTGFLQALSSKYAPF